MMRKILKINFCDFWGDFNKQFNLFLNLLNPHYDIEISENPDVLFYSCYGFEHLKYRCFKIFYTGENVRPDFRECDFSLSYDYDDYGNRNLRVPLYRWQKMENLCLKPDIEKIVATKTKFCCMLVSNPNGRERNEFFEKLSRYKKVDSGGRYLNNIGYPIENKMDFINEYKFVLSFENSSYPGYATEKMVEPMMKNCLPVYWGNPYIDRDFNPKSFINIHDYKTFDDAILEIIRIDSNDEVYRDYLEQPFFANNKMPQTLENDFISKKIYEPIESFKGRAPVSTSNFNRCYQHGNKIKKQFLSRLNKKPHWYC